MQIDSLIMNYNVHLMHAAPFTIFSYMYKTAYKTYMYILPVSYNELVLFSLRGVVLFTARESLEYLQFNFVYRRISNYRIQFQYYTNSIQYK